jgi:hypothetical protein
MHGAIGGWAEAEGLPGTVGVAVDSAGFIIADTELLQSVLMTN